MAAPYLISALDIGGEKIKLSLAEFEGPEKALKFIDYFQEPSFGIRRGVVVDIEEVAKKILSLKEKAEKSLKIEIEEVFINIDGSHLFMVPSRGTVAVSRADHYISEEDVERAIEAAEVISLPFNKEIIKTIPQKFIVDTEKNIKNPLGMKGTRLEVEILAIGCFSPYYNNLKEAIGRADLDIVEISPSVLASAESVLSQRQKEFGVALLDIGSWTTGLAVFEEGSLIHLAIFPFGSGNITNDIAIGFQTELEVAEFIKLKYGTLNLSSKKGQDKIEVLPKEILKEAGFEADEKKKIVFSKKTLNHIIEARISEMFDEIQKELKKIGRLKMLPAGIVLTGGGSKIPDLDSFAAKNFKLPAKLGYPKGFENCPRDLALATSCGLLLIGKKKILEETKSSKNHPLNWFKKIFRIFESS